MDGSFQKFKQPFWTFCSANVDVATNIDTDAEIFKWSEKRSFKWLTEKSNLKLTVYLFKLKHQQNHFPIL